MRMLVCSGKELQAHADQVQARADLLNLQSAGIDLGDAEPSRREGASGRCSVSLLPAVSPARLSILLLFPLFA